MACLLADGLSRERYAATQARFYGILAPLESSLQSTGVWHGLGLTPLQNAANLSMDIRALGIDTDSLAQQTLNSPADIFGSLGRAYVLEGSALGARYIERHLRGLDWFDPERYGRYFSQAVQDSRWQRFKSGLNGTSVNQTELNSLRAEAMHTFQLINNWMAE